MKNAVIASAAVLSIVLLYGCLSTTGQSAEPDDAWVAMDPAPMADPSVDRVGFPEGWDKQSIFYEFDRPDNKSARVIYANRIAASVTPEDFELAGLRPDRAFPYGSVLTMAVYRTKRDADKEVVLDADGRYVRDQLFGLFVMRKERGFGQKYGDMRNGEWEYASYRPDGSTLTPPVRTISCATCHIEAGQTKDWVFGVNRHLTQSSPIAMAASLGPSIINLADYSVGPKMLSVKVGTEVTFVNNDLFMHVMLDAGGEFSTRSLRPGASFKHTFESVGTYDYSCAVHPSMRGTVEVIP